MIMMLHFTRFDSKIWYNTEKSESFMKMIASFSFVFYVFTNSSNCKKQLYLGCNLRYLSKKCQKPIFKVFQNQTSASVKKIGKAVTN